MSWTPTETLLPGGQPDLPPEGQAECPEPPLPASQHFSPLSFPQMSQGSPNLGSLLNMATAEAEGAPAAESSPFLGKAVKALVQEKLAEPWKVYLRR